MKGDTALNKLDLCKYADVFYGNFETDRFFEDGLASKWFYIKAQCGNTYPHATLPFGKMSVGAYSGAYPTGYGINSPNSCGGIYKLWGTPTARGFSHLHQSGTGGIRYYYNYAVTTPFYGGVEEINNFYPLEDETARPGFYSASINGISCRLTVDGGVALHNYRFKNEGGRVAIDFSNDGLHKRFGKDFSSSVKEGEITVTGDGEVAFSGIFSSIRLYFCVKAYNAKKCRIFSDATEIDLPSFSVTDEEKPFGVVFDFDNTNAEIRIAYSTVSREKAVEELKNSTDPFDKVVEKAYNIWNEALSAITIETDDETLKQKFYSNLYHSLIKPCDMNGERVLGVGGELVSDLATMWDQYKTAIPLIFMCFPKMGKSISQTIVNISRAFGKIPCSFGLTDIFPCEEQAKMLGILMLCEAYHYGVEGVSSELIDECIERELKRDDFRRFLEKGIFDRFTHIIDTTDACFYASKITDNEELKQRLLSLAENWRNAYAPDGLLSERSPYYEGDRYTYAFRPQANMEERVSLAGGKERFAKMLDDFFGFGKDSIKQITYPGADKEIAATSYHRFQGFNNECDLEAPYAYIFADRHDRICEIVHECVTRSFGMGRSGLPGNNDSGGLSSCFIWNALGIFPVCGRGEFLIGAPQISKAEISLISGNKLTVSVRNKGIYVDKVIFNGKEIDNFRIPASEIISGGNIEFYMK